MFVSVPFFVLLCTDFMAEPVVTQVFESGCGSDVADFHTLVKTAAC
jgi:hypothetical protein